MDDSSIASFADTLGSDLESALSKSIKPPGVISEGLLGDISENAHFLKKSLKRYERAFSHVTDKSSASPSFQFSYKYLHDKADEVAESFGIPTKYNNKDYKKLFNIGLSKLLPFMRLKKRSQEKINTSTKQALASMSSLYGAIGRASMSLSSVYQNVSSSPAKGDSKDDPSSTDEETALEKYVGDIERGLGLRGKEGDSSSSGGNTKPAPGTRSSPLFTPNDYDAYIAKHKKEIRAPSAVVSSNKKEIIEGLTYASPSAFRVIVRSARSANALAISLELAARAAQETKQPALYIACASLSKVIQEVYSIIRSSVSRNKKNLAKMDKDLKERGDLSNLFSRNSR